MSDRVVPGKGESERSSQKNPPFGMSKRERRFIIVSDLLIVSFILLDLLFIANMISLDPVWFAGANLIMLLFTYSYVRFKRRIALRVLRQSGTQGL